MGFVEIMGPIEFWFEFASTYSYVAALRIEDVAAARQAPITWKPFLLGPIFRNQGWNDSPFNLNPARGRYMWRDIERLCDKYGLPFRRPSLFPRNSLLAARVACAGGEEPWLRDFARAVFRANFAEDRDISDEGLIEGILNARGADGRAVIARARSPENKERLRRETERAWSRGIFGAPSFVVGDELFWGHERLEDALAWHRRSVR